jgi:hypothetical protein
VKEMMKRMSLNYSVTVDSINLVKAHGWTSGAMNTNIMITTKGNGTAWSYWTDNQEDYRSLEVCIKVIVTPNFQTP